MAKRKLPEFEGKHTRFLYKDDDDERKEDKFSKEKQLQKYLTDSDKRHIRFIYDSVDEDLCIGETSSKISQTTPQVTMKLQKKLKTTKSPFKKIRKQKDISFTNIKASDADFQKAANQLTVNPADKDKGTTLVGLVLKKGVVMAADCRVSRNNLPYKDDGIKIENFKNLVWSRAGYLKDAKMWFGFLKSKLTKKAEKADKLTVEGAAKFLDDVRKERQRQGQMLYHADLLLAGLNGKKPSAIYCLNQSGYTRVPDLKCCGSGADFAYMKVRECYNKRMSIEYAVEVCQRAILHASRFDRFTGGGVIVFTITADHGIQPIGRRTMDQLAEAFPDMQDQDVPPINPAL